MKLQHLTTTALLAGAATASHEKPGYTCHPHCIEPTIQNANNLTFGRHYAVLNLDLINGLVGGVAETPAGEAFISNTAKWIDAVHAQDPPPLSIFTRIYFSNAKQPEIGPQSPFKQVGGALGTKDSNATKLYPAFEVDEKAGDVVLQKTRYYAGSGNSLEQILNAQNIRTVVLSGIRTSGVILNTAYQLFNADYEVYVIANNTIETPPDGPLVNKAILEGVLPKLPANVITIEQAMEALNRSGPAIYH